MAHEPHRPGAVLVEIPDYISEKVNNYKQSMILCHRAVGAVECAVSTSGRDIFREKASKHKEVTLKDDRMRRSKAMVGTRPVSTR